MVRELILVLALVGLGAEGGCAKSLTANEMPRPRAGLWARVTVLNGTTDTGQVCLAGKPLHVFAACPGETFSQPSAGVFEAENKCQEGGGAYSDIKSRYTGDFKTSYVDNGTGLLATVGKPPFVSKSQNTYTFVGPSCPPGLAPVDLD
jgi:hypothetical protein